MALANQTEVSDGSLTYIEVGIEFFEQDDIGVFFGLETVPLVEGVDYQWTSATRITFLAPNTPVPNGTVVTLRRGTKLDSMYNLFDGGAPFDRYTLDENFRQLLYRTQEFSEGLGFSGIQQSLNMNNYRIINLGDGVDPEDAVNRQQLDAVEAIADGAVAIANNAEQIAQDALDLVTSQGVYSFNGRQGVVVPLLGDYSAALIGYGGSSTVKAELDLLIPAVNSLDLTAVRKDSDTGSAQMPAGTTAERSPDGAGKMRFNTETGRFEGNNGTDWGSLGGATGGGNDAVFYESDIVVNADYTIPVGRNAMAAGPISVADGAVVTVPDGSTLTIV